MGRGRVTGLRAFAPLLAAAALTGGAFLAVERAGCDEPGRYEPRPAGGYELVGGCLAPGDILVPEPAAEPPAGTEPGLPARS